MHPFQFNTDKCSLVAASAKEMSAVDAVRNITIKWVALLICIQEVAGLYLILKTSYPNSVSFSFQFSIC
jgi:hypothetical protein